MIIVCVFAAQRERRLRGNLPADDRGGEGAFGFHEIDERLIGLIGGIEPCGESAGVRCSDPSAPLTWTSVR